MTPPLSALEHAFEAAVARYTAANPGSAAALERARAVLPGGNTRSSLWSAPFPLCIVGGEGCRIRDVDGHDYVDFLGEFTAGIFGHSPERLSQALSEAQARGINLSSHTPYEIELAERLVARFPSMDRVRFANSGTEATIMALTAARLVTGRERILGFDGGYHGGVATFLPGAERVNAPYRFDIRAYDDIPAAEAAFAGGEPIAAVLVESMQGAGGCRVARPEFLARLRALCDASGAVLIFDEVQTARMSVGGMQARLGITPDMTTVGKFFGGGLAFGAFGGKAAIMDRFDPARPDALAHAGTFNNNSLTMATGVAAIDHYLPAEALDALFERGEAFRNWLNRTFAAAGVPFEATGLGSILNIHARLETPEASTMLRRLLQFEMMARGQYFAARGLIALSLAIGPAEIDAFFAALEDVLPGMAQIVAQDA